MNTKAIQKETRNRGSRFWPRLGGCLLAAGLAGLWAGVAAVDAAVVNSGTEDDAPTDSSEWYLDGELGADTEGLATDLRALFLGEDREEQKTEALSEAEQQAAEEPDNVRAQARLGDWYFLLNRLDEAARQYWQAARLDPRNLRVLESLGFSMLSLNDHENGLAVYDRVLARGPRPHALFNRASALAHLKRYDEAIEGWQAYLRRYDSVEWRALYNVGVTHYHAGRPREALRALKAVLQQIGEQPFVLAASIRALREVTPDSEAIEVYGNLLREQLGAVAAQRVLEVETLPIYLVR